MDIITHEEAVQILRDIVGKEGTQLAAAKRLDTSPQFLSDILLGRRAIPDSLARKIGYRRVISFEPINQKKVRTL